MIISVNIIMIIIIILSSIEIINYLGPIITSTCLSVYMMCNCYKIISCNICFYVKVLDIKQFCIYLCKRVHICI